jgi:5-(carboxyamino)imidazole ribonucleotide synthase
VHSARSWGHGDLGDLAELARRADVVTFEFENVPAKALEILAELGVETAPCARALAIALGRRRARRRDAGRD